MAFIEGTDRFQFQLLDFFAFDGTKIKANCSKKCAFTLDKLNNALVNIDEKINEYISKIDNNCDILTKPSERGQPQVAPTFSLIFKFYIE